MNNELFQNEIDIIHVRIDCSEGYTTASLLNQEDNFKIISKTLLVIVSIIKKNSATNVDIINTITVVVIVSFLVGHTIFETSFLTC